MSGNSDKAYQDFADLSRASTTMQYYQTRIETPANAKQIGGDHYKSAVDLQHWDVVARMGWCYYIGNATKYLWRLGKKGGPEKAIEDIGKAIHYLEKKRELLQAELDGSAPTRGYVNQD